MAARLRLGGRWLAALVVGVSSIVAACAGTAGTAGQPSAALPPAAASLGPARTVGPAVAQTRAELVRVLGTRNLVLQDTQAPFRPPEDATFTTTPRALYQVILPDAPSEGFIVVYEFGDPGRAADAAQAQAAYLASGPVKVQSPLGARHVLRLLGSTVVLYSWVPAGVEDPRQPDIEAALDLLGTGVAVPS
jgi:hypothetical protein